MEKIEIQRKMLVPQEDVQETLHTDDKSIDAIQSELISKTYILEIAYLELIP